MYAVAIADLDLDNSRTITSCKSILAIISMNDLDPLLLPGGHDGHKYCIV